MYLGNRNSVTEQVMLRAMANDWAYPIRKLVQFSVRLLYALYKLGKISRRYTPTKHIDRKTQILQFIVRKRKEQTMAVKPKAKPKSKPEIADEEELDLSELEDLDLGDLDVDLDSDDLEKAVEELEVNTKSSKGAKNGKSSGVSDEALLTLTKEIRDNNTQVLSKVSSMAKEVKSLIEMVGGVVEQIKKLFSFLKADQQRQVEDVKRTKEILEKPSKASKKAAPVEEDEDDEEGGPDVDPAVQKRIVKIYQGNWKKFPSIPKFAAACAKSVDASEEEIIEVLRANSFVGRGGKCKDPSGE